MTVVDDPETQRVKQNTHNISQVAYSGHKEVLQDMEYKRPAEQVNGRLSCMVTWRVSTGYIFFCIVYFVMRDSEYSLNYHIMWCEWENHVMWINVSCTTYLILWWSCNINNRSCDFKSISCDAQNVSFIKKCNNRWKGMECIMDQIKQWRILLDNLRISSACKNESVTMVFTVRKLRWIWSKYVLETDWKMVHMNCRGCAGLLHRIFNNIV